MAEINFDQLYKNGLLHGGDYNPEQWRWRPETMAEDIEMMKLAKINVVSMAMFAWSALEPKEDVYDFKWLDNAIDALYENGILVFLSTPSAAKPAWLARKYPEVLRTDKYNNKLLFGERHNHCFTSPIYRNKVKKIDEKLAERYKDHPGVVLWHISNEFEGECYCTLCQAAFRKWLKKRYTNISELNQAWWTGFWGHTFTDWDEINAPTPIGDFSLDGLNLDWRRFVTDQTVDFYRMEVETVKKITPDRPVTTNFHDFPNPKDGLNYWKFAPYLDIVAWDNYPYWHNEHNDDVLEGARRDFIHDINRCILDKPFLLMESCPGATNWQPVARLPKPGIVALQSMQAIAHGSDSVQYFQMRKSLGASEKFHGAVIDHYASKKTRIFKEVMQIGADLSKLSSIVGSKIDAKVAIIYDWENKWSLDNIQGLNAQRHEYFSMCINHYYPLWKSGVNVDVINMEHEIANYKVLIAPMLYMLPAKFADILKEFVENGGILITGPFSGVVDENQLAYMSGRPGPLRNIAGIWVEETDSLYASQFNAINKYQETEKNYTAKWFCDILHVEGAQTLYTYDRDFYANTPAVTVNCYGRGKVYYIATILEQKFYDDFYLEFIKNYLSEYSFDLPDGVSLSTRKKGKQKYIFIANYNDYVINFDFNLHNCEILVGTQNKPNELILLPYSYAVIKC